MKKSDRQKSLDWDGPVPKCIGNYGFRVVECNATPACVWRAGCNTYRVFCKERGVKPAKELEVAGDRVVRTIVVDLMREWQQGRAVKRYGNAYRMWSRFLGALQAAMVPFNVCPERDRARHGELYVKAWITARSQRPHKWIVRVKGTTESSKNEKPVIRLTPEGGFKTMEPTVELRTTIEKALEVAPNLPEMVTRIEKRIPTEDRFKVYLGVNLVRVLPDRIEDVARIAARLLVDGHMTGITPRKITRKFVPDKRERRRS